MKLIVNSSSFFSKISGYQSVDYNAEYKVSKFVVTADIDNGYLVYNTLFGNLFFISKEEYAFLSTGKITNEIQKSFVLNWLLVKNDTDENAAYFSYESIVSSFTDKNLYNSFTILVTTDCNARCYYCYQHGIEHNYMTKQTAKKVAEFITQNCKGNAVLHWFGGEPLLNIEAIDEICDYLKNNNVSFYSTIISNTYLFNKETIEKSVNKWNLKKIQITLDGTRDVYNKIKAYIYDKSEDAFDKVISNIKSLVKYDIKLNIRLNISENNIDDMTNLVCYIKNEIGTNKNLTVYTALLFDLRANKNTDSDFLLKIKELDDLIFNLGLFSRDLTNDGLNIVCCMANNDNSLVVGPLGEFLKCEHYNKNDIIGNIDSKVFNSSIINAFKEKAIPDDCLPCAFITKCHMLKKCENYLPYCTDYRKEHILRQTVYKMKNTYFNIKSDN